MATRNDVYVAINTERAYQDKRWPNERAHTTDEFILFMEHYLHEARRLASTTPDGNVEVLDFVRKVTALGVACMEQNGAPRRAEPGCEHVSGPTRCSNCAYES